MGTSKRVKLRCNTSTSVTNSVPSIFGLAGYGFEKSSFGARVWVWVRVRVEDFGASRRHSQKYC
jgi:hypothetical protein